jgi:hypothetical protein
VCQIIRTRLFLLCGCHKEAKESCTLFAILGKGVENSLGLAACAWNHLESLMVSVAITSSIQNDV